MNPRQYKPFTFKLDNLPLIVYPVKGDYHIVFVWNLEKHRMADVWVHDMNNWSDSGPLVSCITFRDLKQCSDAGIASGDT